MASRQMTFKCGCRATKIGATFYYRPCKKPDCKVYPYVLAETQKRGNGLTFHATDELLRMLKE